MGTKLNESRVTPHEPENYRFIVDAKVISKLEAMINADPNLRSCISPEELELIRGQDIDVALTLVSPELAELLEAVFEMVSKAVPEFVEGRIVSLTLLANEESSAARFMRMADLYFQNEDPSEAVVALDKALDLADTEDLKMMILKKLVTAYVEMKKVVTPKEYLANLTEYLNMMLMLNPEDPFVHFSCAVVCEELGSYKRAERHIRKAIDLDPENSKYHHLLGDLFFASGRFEDAMESYEFAQGLDPQDPILVGKIRRCVHEFVQANAENPLSFSTDSLKNDDGDPLFATKKDNGPDLN